MTHVGTFHEKGNPGKAQLKVLTCRRTWLMLLFTASVGPMPARAHNDPANEYGIEIFPSHRVTDRLSAQVYLGYMRNPDDAHRTYILGWPRLNYSPYDWLQIWGGLTTYFTENGHSSDKLELRPLTGIKLFIPNSVKWNIYIFTRYEHRAIQDLSRNEWTDTHRLRKRFGVEFPFASTDRAWQPDTFYALTDAEPYYSFDHREANQLQVRGGIGYILNTRMRVEFVYHAKFTHPAAGNEMQHTDNVFLLKIRARLSKGIVGWLRNRDMDE